MKHLTLLLATALTAASLSGTSAAAAPAIDLECEINPSCLDAALNNWAIAQQGASSGAAPSTMRPSLVVQSLTMASTAGYTRTIRSAAHVNTQVQAERVERTPQIDTDAIARRDAQMFDSLTRQVIAMSVDAGLANDGETTGDERRAVEAFYDETDHAPIFVQAGTLTDQGRALLETFASADAYGLNPADFENDAFLAPGELAGDAVAAAHAEINMALWAVRYARHAQTGRVNPSSIASDITLARNIVDPATVMPTLMAADNVSEALLAYHPQHAQFHALREELERLRNRAPEDIIQPIAEGGTIRLGDVDSRVPELRARLGVADPVAPVATYVATEEATIQLVSGQAGDLIDNLPAEIEEPAPEPVNLDLFDAALDEAVKAFQADHNLTADGIVGPATFAALNEQAGDLSPHIIANMERWRWMPRELGDFHVIANVPEYRLWVRDEGETIFTTRTVVGRNRHRTAIFSDEMEYIAVNPYWNVPSSIARSEILPRLLQDPGYAHRGNYDVIYNGNLVDPFAINWQAAAEQGVMPRIRQRPGRGNALGEIKFMFPNQHAIYFHDTPSRGLFSRDQRAFSHGCVRVLDPWAFAEALLTNEPDWDLSRARGLQGSRERNIILENRIQVHLTYFTARVADDGRLIMARDIYGHHARVMNALGLDAS